MNGYNYLKVKYKNKHNEYYEFYIYLTKKIESFECVFTYFEKFYLYEIMSVEYAVIEKNIPVGKIDFYPTICDNCNKMISGK